MTDKETNPQGVSPGDFCGGKFDIETSILETALEEIKIDELRKVGENLRLNLRMVDYMTTLPYVICSFMNAEYSKVVWEIKGRLASGVRFPDKADEEERRKYIDKMTEIIENEVKPQRYKIADEAMERGDHMFIHLLENELISTPYYKGILRSGIILLWCSIEVFMRDLWETSLNIGGKTIIGNVLSKLGKLRSEQDTDNIQGKFINIEYLAKFDYDLSKVLGTALLHKFDFTSLYGIRDAFLYAFPRSKTIKNAIESKPLVELSSNRNLIIHNAGIIDEEYCSKLGVSSEQIGDELFIDNHNICKVGKGVMETGIAVLNAVSSMVLADRSHGA